MVRVSRMRSDPQRNWILAVCSGTHAVQDGLGAALFVLVPVLAQALGLSYAQVGLIRATKAAATSLFELPSGFLAERWGERRLLVFGLASAGAGYLWLSTATGLTLVLVSLFVAGVGAAFQHALCSAVVSRTFDVGARRSALGLYNSSGDAGKLIFSGLFSVLVGIGIAWQGLIVLFGGVAVLMAIAVLVTLTRLGVGGPSPETGQANEGDKAVGWGIRDRTGFSALCLAISLDTAVQAGFLVFVAFIVADKGVTTELASFAVVLTLVGGIFGKAGCGYLAERLGVRRSLALVQLCTAGGILGLVVMPALGAFVVLPVLGMFLQGSSSITYGSVGDFIHNDRQSRGFGVVYSVSGLASVSGPVLFGIIGDSAGLGTVAVAMAGISILAIGPSLLLKAPAPA